MDQSAYRTLPIVLLDLLAKKPLLVLMKGKDYWRIEHAASQARRDASSGPPSVREFLGTPRFFWTDDPSGKVVIMEDGEDGIVPFAVEPGALIDIPN